MTRTKHTKERWQAEADAFRYAMGRSIAEERRDLLVNGGFVALATLAGVVGSRIEDGSDVKPEDVLPILDGKSFRTLKSELEAHGALNRLLGPQDPQAGQKAYAELLAAFDGKARSEALADEFGELRAGLLDGSIKPDAVGDRLRIALRTAGRIDDQWHDVGELWREAQEEANKPRCKPTEGVMLRPERGDLAHWFNESFGPRGALTPGRTVLIGGAPGAGKTSLGAVIAADALHAGCAVMLWQLELGAVESLEHLIAQHLCGEAGRPVQRDEISQYKLPEAWPKLLRIPRGTGDSFSDLETIEEHALDFAAWCRQERSKGQYEHEVNGLLVVDYVQLATTKSARPQAAQHEVLATICSRLAKLAADEGLVLVLLSQITKDAQRTGSAGMASFSGADLSRMAHVAFTVTRAKQDEGGGFVPVKGDDNAHRDQWGEARLIKREKDRGTVCNGVCAPGTEEGDAPPHKTRLAYVKSRAIHHLTDPGSPAPAPASTERPSAARGGPRTRPSIDIGKFEPGEDE